MPNPQRSPDYIVPRSSVEGLTWPALTDQHASQLLALQFQLDQSQWWTAETIRRHQFAQLEILLEHAQRTVPYYRDLLERYRFKAGTGSLEAIWSDIPILSRQALQDAGDLLHSEAVPKQHGGTQRIFTSGSTGSPVSLLDTGLTQLMWQAFTLREQRWHGRDLSAKLAVIRVIKGGKADAPDGMHLNVWGGATGSIYDTGPCELLNLATPINEQVDWLLRHEPDYLLTCPTNLQSLAEYCLEHDIKLKGLRGVSTFSEALGANLRDLVRRVWDIEVQDIYSSVEVGNIALQCPEHECYHVQAENMLVEILDEEGQACQYGEVGRVVVTPLHNFATPLIRYDLGDYAEVGEECSCGRGLPVLTSVRGRFRNMVVLPTGERFWPVFQGFAPFLDIVNFRQVQMIQHSLDWIEVIMVVDTEVRPEQQQELGGIIQEILGYPFKITFSFPDEIPRSKGGKYEEFISKLK